MKRYHGAQPTRGPNVDTAALREEHGLRTSENRVLKSVIGPKREKVA
jgi:hypothetical protein